MKTLTATVAALATIATLSAAPAMAESSAYEQRAKLQQLFKKSAQPAKYTNTVAPKVTKVKRTDRVISTRMATGPEKALKRLGRSQPNPSGGR